MNTAEVLTPMPTLARDDSENGDHYEIIDGVKVEMPPMSVDSQIIPRNRGRGGSGWSSLQQFEMTNQHPLALNQSERRNPLLLATTHETC